MRDVYKLGLGFTILIVGSVFFIEHIIIYFFPFIISIVVASLIDPIVNLLESRANVPRGLAVLIVLAIIIILISLLLTVSFSKLFIELENLANDFPDYQVIGDKIGWITEQNKEFSRLIEELKVPTSVKEEINNNLQNFYDKIRNLFRFMLSTLLGLVKQLPRLLTTLLISLIATFFISRDKKLIIRTCLAPFPQQWKEKIKQLQIEIVTAAAGFIRAQMILITITTLLFILGLTILNSDYTLVGGLSAGILDLIPVIGPGVIFIPWGGYNLIIGQTKFGIGLLLLHILVGVIRQMIEAKIVGQSIGIHPLATLIAMYLGVQLFGITGFFIGPALLIVLRAVFHTGFVSIINK